MANPTTISIQGLGLDFTFPFNTSTTYVKGVAAGYFIGSYATYQWTGSNLTYSEGFVLPSGGQLNSFIFTKADNTLIFGVNSKYTIKPSDSTLNPFDMLLAIAFDTDVDWVGSTFDDKFYWFSKTDSVNNTFDGKSGSDSFIFSFNSSEYIFSKYNLSKSSITVTSTRSKTAATLTSIENFVFADKTLSFSQMSSFVDNAGPIISSFSPANDVAVNSNITITFNESIKPSVGIVKLFNWNTYKILETFDLSKSKNITLSDAAITINPTKDLAYNTEYYLQVYSVEDLNGNIMELSSLNFTSTNTFITTAPKHTLGKTPDNLTFSGSGNFTGNGNANNNIITGGRGNDTLNGQLGNDTLIGGLGNDTFVFNTKLGPTNIDTITDFTSGDKIALAGSIFSKLKGDKDLSDNFKAAALDSNDYLIYDSANGKLYYDADGSGTKSQPIQIALIGTNTYPTLSASDFMIV